MVSLACLRGPRTLLRPAQAEPLRTGESTERHLSRVSDTYGRHVQATTYVWARPDRIELHAWTWQVRSLPSLPHSTFRAHTALLSDVPPMAFMTSVNISSQLASLRTFSGSSSTSMQALSFSSLSSFLLKRLRSARNFCSW